MQTRRIALVAPPWYPVPPVGYGGVELVVGLLARELRERGHEVVLFGSDGSGPGTRTLVPAGWDRDLGRPSERWRELAYASRLADALRREPPFDIIHDHGGGGTLLTAEASRRGPVLHTVHGPLGEPERTFYATLAGRVGLAAISQSQRGTAPGLPWVATVPNAVDVDALRIGPAAGRDRTLVCLARICPDKGQHIAIAVARRTGRPLVLAGKVERTPASQAYFEREIQPHLDGVRVRHLPNVAGREKADLLAGAGALLAPVQWPEPFGLAVAEAMASGTPAIAFRQGAMPELVEDGITGVLCDDVDDMVAAVRVAATIDPVRCARRARARFGPSAMADGYLDTYAGLAMPAVRAPAPASRAGAVWAPGLTTAVAAPN